MLQSCPRTVRALDLPLSFLYESVIEYLQSIVDPEKERVVLFGQKGFFLMAAYNCCCAFKLVNVAHHFSWIARDVLVDLVQQVAHLFEKTGNQCNTSYNTPRIYGKYLQLLIPSLNDSTEPTSDVDSQRPNRSGLRLNLESDPTLELTTLLDSYQRLAEQVGHHGRIVGNEKTNGSTD